ncbi:hypothetical protein ALC62_01145 [Cyphomyrmex costatus]|uniref:GIY-YIG domain-containing protein n=1 Tax=Cyphomyrmex costatus TaxID=456900 RepID=A0A151IPM1_9HYME|nr:hypothetical protein ALC62_01145 [Cyphomyrmex costatus]
MLFGTLCEILISTVSSLISAGVYEIPCSCGKVYIGETVRMVNTRMKEHQRDVRLKHITQSALAEHNIETGHRILFDKMATIATTTSYFPRKHREALKIQKHSDNLNRDSGYNVSRIWKTALSTGQRSTPSPTLQYTPPPLSTASI